MSTGLEVYKDQTAHYVEKKHQRYYGACERVLPMTLEMKSMVFLHTAPVCPEPAGVPGAVNGGEVSGEQAGSQDSGAGDQAGVRALPD